MKTYTKKDSLKFIADMDEGGYKVEHYQGRFYWEGPAVRVNDAYELSDVIAATSVRCQWDNLGLGYIIYPRQSDAGEDTKGQTA